MRRLAAGFTLIEMIVVIAIITILASLMGVFIVQTVGKARIASTHARLRTLDFGCKLYKQEHNAYPADNRGDSRCLHEALGSRRMVVKARLEGGTVVGSPAGPIVEFPADWLQLARGQVADPSRPVPIVDAWDGLIQYKVPGVFNKGGVDLWSRGRNGQDDLVGPGGDTDDVSNWMKEF